MLRLVVLVSGSGTNFADLLRRTREGSVPAEIVAVGADRECGGLDVAREAGLTTFVESFAQPREAWSARLASRIRGFDADLVVLSGFMRLLSPVALEPPSPALINTHPSLLPLFPGAHAVADTIAAGATSTGASVIQVDAGVDTGPILAQQRVEIQVGDTERTLHERIKIVERELLASVVTGVADGSINLGAILRTGTEGTG